MPGLSDLMLAGGCAAHVEAVHGEWVKVLTGTDAGKSFLAVNEVESDEVLEMQLGSDPRGKRMLRFRLPDLNAAPGAPATVPALASQDRVQTEDGRMWNAVQRPDSSYLTTDFELTEIVGGIDD